MKRILVTGGAGFIGSNLMERLLKESKREITCIDNFDAFYDSKIKKNNIKNLLKHNNFRLIKADIRNSNTLKKKLSKQYDVIIHLAARVGVLPSLKNPTLYSEVNVLGTQNMLTLAKELQCKKFIFASSSSVYGINSNIPWSENDRILYPISPYAATKISGELLGHVHSYIYGFQFIGLRFFSVYGPRQRPDLAIYKFTQSISNNRPITLYGDGKTRRDYTYIDDIVSGISSSLDYSKSRYEIFNLGNNQPVMLRELVSQLEGFLRKKAIVKKLPDEQGEVPATFANINKAKKLLGYNPKTTLSDGLQKFVTWYKSQK